jgi:hypothetical protein
MAIDFKNEAGMGIPEDGQDFGVPFLQICQTGNPQLIEGHQLYIPDLRAGLIFDTMTNRVFKEVTILPIRYTFRTVEWKPRDKGGGFVKSYARGEEPTDTISDQVTGRFYRVNGNNLVQTMYHLVMIKEEEWDKVIISMSSTQLKKARRWNSTMASYRIEGSGNIAPIFSHYFKLSTVREQNNFGTWFGWKIDPAGVIEDEQLYTVAKATYQQMENFLPERLIAQIGNGNGDKDIM